MIRSRLVFVWIILLILLSLRFFLFFNEKQMYQVGDSVSFTATLLEEPKRVGNTQRFAINAIPIVTSAFPQHHYGDRLTIAGVVSQSATSNQKGEVLMKRDAYLMLYFPDITIAQKDKEIFASALSVMSSIRQQALLVMAQSLPASSAGLLSGITLGAKEGFSQHVTQALTNTGTLHVVVASGMNISIFASFLLVFLKRILRRKVAAVCIMLSIFFYAFLAVFEPPIVRASIMGALAFTAGLFNRASLATLGLAFAAYAMLIFDPSLLFDIGFQLSFAATAGLLFLKPLFAASFSWFAELAKVVLLGEGLTTTLVAQVAVLPILLANFGTFSLVSILVNALVLWAVPSIMMLGILGCLLLFLPILPSLAFVSALPLLFLFEQIVLLFDRPIFLIPLPLPFAAAVGYYCLLVAFYLLLRRKEELKVPFGVTQGKQSEKLKVTVWTKNMLS